MQRHLYSLLAMISGALWAGLAYVLANGMMGQTIWGGLIAAPFIGMAVAAVYRLACDWPWPVRALLSLLTLFIAAALFGLACGAYDAFIRAPGPGRVTLEVVLQAMFATIWYLTSGMFLLLGPLAFFNHELLCWLAPADSRRDPKCPTCGYTLRGLTSHRCPECGESTD